MAHYVTNADQSDPVPDYVFISGVPRCQICKAKCRKRALAIGFKATPYLLCGRYPCRSSVIKYGCFRIQYDVTEGMFLPDLIVNDYLMDRGLDMPPEAQLEKMRADAHKGFRIRAWKHDIDFGLAERTATLESSPITTPNAS